jgi:hypothetical protein
VERQAVDTGSWVQQATSMQTSNGSAPTSDWDQGYGYQFWRSRHNSFRGDGAFGQYCMVIPELDAVVAITSGVRNMQQVMNLVWDKLLPAMKPGRLTEIRRRDDNLNPGSRRSRLNSQTVRHRLQSPQPFPESGSSSRKIARGIKAVSFDFSSTSPALIVRTATGETRMTIGRESWNNRRGQFANGLERALSVPANPLVAASGAWSATDTFTVKIVLSETPYYSTLNFKFDGGDRLLFDAEYNVSFGPTKLPQLIGSPARVSSCPAKIAAAKFTADVIQSLRSSD